MVQRVVVWAGLVVMVLVAACGDDDADTATPSRVTTQAATTTTEPGPLSNEEFTARAKAICEEADQQIAALGFRTTAQFGEVEEAGTYQEMADYMEGVSNAEIEARDQLRDLTPPLEEVEIVGQFLSALDDLIEFNSGYVAALRAEDLTGFKNVTVPKAAESEVRGLALQLGLFRCSLGVP